MQAPHPECWQGAELRRPCMQMPKLVGGLAARSQQHRDILCRMAAQALEAVASGSPNPDANAQTAARCSPRLPCPFDLFMRRLPGCLEGRQQDRAACPASSGMGCPSSPVCQALKALPAAAHTRKPTPRRPRGVPPTAFLQPARAGILAAACKTDWGTALACLAWPVLHLSPASLRHDPGPCLCRILEATSEADRGALLAFLAKLVVYLPPASLATGPRGASIGGPMGLAMQQMGLPTALGPAGALQPPGARRASP